MDSPANAPIENTTAADSIIAVVSEFVSDICSAPLNDQIPPLLESLGKATDVDRVYIFELQQDAQQAWLASISYEWFADGWPPKMGMESLQNAPMSPSFERWTQAFLQRETIASIVEDLPEEEALPLKALEIQSILVTPILSGDQLWGFIGYDDCRTARRWLDTEKNALQLLSLIIGNALFKEHLQTTLSKEHNQLETLVEAIPDLVWLKDKMGVYLSCNKRFESFFGAKAAEIIGKTDYDFVDKALADFFRQHDQNAMAQNKPTINEEEITFAEDGHKEVLETIKTPVRLKSGELQGVLGIGRDITERKKTEKLLEEERSLFAEGPVAVLVWHFNQHWTIEYASPNVDQVFGYSQAQFLDQKFHYDNMIFDEDLALVREKVQSYLAEGRESWQLSYRVLGADGKMRWLNDFTRVEKDCDGKVVRLRGYVMDDTERRSDQHKLELYAKIFESSHDAIVICDLDVRIINVNPAFTGLSGLQASEVIGHHPHVVLPALESSAFYLKIWKSLKREGFWVGELESAKPDGEHYTMDATMTVLYDLHGNVSNYVGIFADITHHKSQQALIEKQAHFDALTGLPNRHLLSDRLEQAIALSNRNDMQLAVCFIDLDEFKPINDNHGHDKGDEVLIEISERLNAVVRREDTVARLGGDEFVLLLNEIDSLEHLQTALNRILATLRSPLKSLKLRDAVSASIGVAITNPVNREEGLLLRQADQAMYLAKKRGRNQYHIFDHSIDNFLQQQLEIQEEIKLALKHSEFELYYQPKVKLLDGEVVSFEALIRWNHPEKGLLQPASFLPFLDGQVQALEVDKWVLKKVLQQYRWWQYDGASYRISVNIAAETLLSDQFLPFLKDLVRGFEEEVREMIELEVLETSSLEDLERAKFVLESCIEMGFSVSLDDFGTGYSSLSYLRHLPIGTLKIDQSFVKEMAEDNEDRTLVESMIALTKSFKMRSVAEGVENQETAEILKEIGCEIIQGYGVAKPMPAKRVKNWVQAWEYGQNWLRSQQSKDNNQQDES